MSPYTDLEARFHRLQALRNALGVLHWDMATMMPSGGAEARAEQLAALNVVCHGMLTEPVVGDLLDHAEGGGANLDEWQRANLREMRRQWVHATALDGKLVEALSKACSASEQVWREARPKGDFAMQLPALTEVLRLTREAAAAKSDRLGVGAYDALLDEYEPGGRSADIDLVFDDLAAFLPGLLARVLEHQERQAAPLDLPGPFPVARQRQLGERIMRTMGFDFEHGRLDTSLHPFCGGMPDDVRITTRYAEDDFASSVMGVIHETGHALYERGLPQQWRHQPVGLARGMSIHESQSLLMEMQACRSAAFIGFLAPLAREAFGGSGPAWDAANFHRLYTRVTPDFIRVEADEVTYPAHVILRYRLEKALIGGDMKLADLPAAWNEGMKKLLGIVPPSDREGCLQDIHWYDGAWGYFPTYTLGAMTAAQLFDAACRAQPSIPIAIGKGDFAPLLTWLR
ncbi:MAG TPA: carboxypeptidase M32, partial [Verrucomicrobiae bacterium]|nr:carboxypeptidase M32 [Verrucomicrobiae bacterium]